MVQVIRDLWVITEAGVVIFDRIFDQQLCADLFGAFLSAITSFSKELTSKGGLTSFKLIETQYTILKVQDLLFVGNSAAKVKENRIISELKIISEKFFNRYQDVLKDYNGNVTTFKGFVNDIDESLEKPIDRIQKALW